MLSTKFISIRTKRLSLRCKARIMAAALLPFKDYYRFSEHLIERHGATSDAHKLLISTTLRTRHRITWNDKECCVFAEAVALTDLFSYQEQATLLTVALRKARHLCTLTDALTLAGEIPQEYITERFVQAFSSAVVRYFSLREQRYTGRPQKNRAYRNIMLTEWQKKIRPDRPSIELKKDIRMYMHCIDLLQRTPQHTWQWPYELFMDDQHHTFLTMLRNKALEDLGREICSL